MDSVIVGKLSDGYPFIPLILALVHKESEELLDLLVNPFSLSLFLQVISHGSATWILRSCLRDQVKFNTNCVP